MKAVIKSGSIEMKITVSSIEEMIDKIVYYSVKTGKPLGEKISIKLETGKQLKQRGLCK